MKTPWRFFIEMASGRKAAPAQLALPTSEVKPEDPASVAERLSLRVSVATIGEPDRIDEAPAIPEPLTTSHEAVAEPSQTLALLPRDENEFSEAGEAEPDRPRMDDIASAPANEVGASSQPKTSRRAKQSGKPVAETAVITGDGQSAHQLPSRGSAYFDDVAGLNDEIRQLRAALARKLSSQNAQLRKMLERFDVS